MPMEHCVSGLACAKVYSCSQNGERKAGKAFKSITHAVAETNMSLRNEDGNVNENATKQWIKLQNTITASENATTWPLSRRRL